ncbi:TPA: 4Fe-4S dicluster domain-containing protein [Clostridium perfringens]|nr:4Fe-4S dicluster domain-containing protein [Clostridium perfringens]
MDKCKVNLFNEKKECCGCGACKNICPKDAITFIEDEYGFTYPQIDIERCIGCELCKKVCDFQKIDTKNSIVKTYAAISKHDRILEKSASGGIFGSLALEFLNKGGVVYGCSMELENNQLYPKHIRVSDVSNLNKILGSKYVQSDLNDCFNKIRKDLLNKRKVLFSGTPCQVASLNLYLSSINIDKLYTVDIICHGVPNSKFFKDYISELEKRLKGTVTNFRFRDKSNGWGLLGAVDYLSNNGSKKTKLINAETSSYFKLFLESSTYRESCYNCKYTNSSRPADLTLGDFWGIQTEHPNYLKENGGILDLKKGISCILVNNSKGINLIEKYGKEINLKESVFEKVSNGNDQLKFPSKISHDRDKILNLYKNNGYSAVDKWFNKRIGLVKYKITIKTLIKAKINRFLIKK